VSSSGLLDSGSSGANLSSEFVSEGEILVGKLTGTLLGSLWLVVVSGWITVSEAIIRIHLVPVRMLARYYTRIIDTIGIEVSRTAEVAWAEAFRSAVEVSPLAAPAILTAEIALVVVVYASARQRWGI